jgi:hypothetical protein
MCSIGEVILNRCEFVEQNHDLFSETPAEAKLRERMAKNKIRLEHIKHEIESFTGKKVRSIELTDRDEWERVYNDSHISTIDGAIDWNDGLRNADDAETMIVFQSHFNPEEVQLLRQVGIKNQNGVAYISNVWLPENNFKGALFSEKEQLAILRKTYYDRNYEWSDIIDVFYELEEEEKPKPKVIIRKKKSCQMEQHIHDLSNIAEEHNICYTSWSYDDYDEPVRDFSQKHPFTAEWVDAGCRDDNCYGYNPESDRIRLTPLKGDTWLDVWKSIDTYCKQKGCGHRFIENIEQEGAVLVVRCGS